MELTEIRVPQDLLVQMDFVVTMDTMQSAHYWVILVQAEEKEAWMVVLQEQEVLDNQVRTLVMATFITMCSDQE